MQHEQSAPHPQNSDTAHTAHDSQPPETPQPPHQPRMPLGNFSVSLAVKDIETSRAFYTALGFTKFGGDAANGWLILKNGDTVIGLFQGMFEKNTLTFNPGWDANAQPLAEFMDVRELQRRIKAQGIALAAEADESTTGPAHCMLIDPDGNPILFDQHR